MNAMPDIAPSRPLLRYHGGKWRLARKFWHERGGAMLTPEELDCLSDRARREIEAVMVARHGKRLGRQKVGT